MSMEELDGARIVSFNDAAAWEAWLSENHGSSGGVWLKVAKKGSGVASVTIAEALDACLCYGWIDSQRRSCDETYFLQRYSPRRSRSSWSKVNVEKAEALVAAGRVQAAGFAEIEAAMADGRWDAAYESQRNAAAPPDLVAALERDERAGVFYGSLNRTERYAVILRLAKARTPEARADVLAKAVAALAAGRKI